MKTANRSNALLVELLIVVMFFMLASTVLLQVFAKARSQSVRAETLTVAMNQTQNVADRVYAREDWEKALSELEFTFDEEADCWVKSEETYDIAVRYRAEEKENGVMHRFQVQATQGDEALLTLPVARFQEVRP